MKKLLTVLTLSILLALTISCTVIAEIPSEWAANEVQAAIVNGFVPWELQKDYTSPITRKEFAKLAVLFTANELGYSYDEFKAYMADKSVGYVYSDCDDEYVLLAAEAGFVYGTGNGMFEPDRTINREEAATLLNRVYFSYGDNSYYFGADFEDKDGISEWAMSGVSWCVRQGIMKGVSDTHFAPKGLYTREQAIVTFVRLSEIDKWESYNQNAFLRRKMTLELAVEEIISSPIYSYKGQFSTPYGEVLYMSQGGFMHLQSRDVIMAVRINDGKVEQHDFGKYVARYNEYGGIPKFYDVKLSDDKKFVTFNVFYEDEQYLSDGTLLHKAGIYYFTVNLETWDISMEIATVENNAHETFVREFAKEFPRAVIERFDTPYGTVLYWGTSGVPHAPSYALTFIDFDNQTHGLSSEVPPMNGWYSTPPLEKLMLSEDETKMTYEVSFSQRAVIQMSGEKVLHEAGTYYFEADLVNGTSRLVEFVPMPEKAPEPKQMEIGISEYLSNKNIALISKHETLGYGTVLHVVQHKDEIGFENEYLVLIGNDGSDHLLGYIPRLTKFGKAPPVTKIEYSGYGDAFLHYEVRYEAEMLTSESEITVPGTYCIDVNLITLEVAEKFVADE